MSTRFRTINMVVGIALDLSFAAGQGAGGWSLSPTLVYCTRVSSAISPAFQIMHVLYQTGIDKIKDADEWGKLIKYCQRKMLHLFAIGRAAPTDVDEDGRTLLHYAANFVSEILLTSVNIHLFNRI